MSCAFHAYNDAFHGSGWREGFQVSRLSEHVRAIIVNAGELAHMSLGDPKVPLIGSEMGDKEANV